MLYSILLSDSLCCHLLLDKVNIKCCQVRKVLFYIHCPNDCTKKEGERLGLHRFSALDFLMEVKLR